MSDFDFLNIDNKMKEFQVTASSLHIKYPKFCHQPFYHTGPCYHISVAKNGERYMTVLSYDMQYGNSLWNGRVNDPTINENNKSEIDWKTCYRAMGCPSNAYSTFLTTNQVIAELKTLGEKSSRTTSSSVESKENF